MISLVDQINDDVFEILELFRALLGEYLLVQLNYLWIVLELFVLTVELIFRLQSLIIFVESFLQRLKKLLTELFSLLDYFEIHRMQPCYHIMIDLLIVGSDNLVVGHQVTDFVSQSLVTNIFIHVLES